MSREREREICGRQSTTTHLAKVLTITPLIETAKGKASSSSSSSRHFGSNDPVTSFSGLNHSPKSRSKSTSNPPFNVSSKPSRVGIEPMKSVPPNMAIGSVDDNIGGPGCITDDGLPRIAEGDGTVIFGVGGAVPPCPWLPVFEPPCPGVRGGFRGDPSGRLLEVDGPPLSLF
jgi:hypothetical protein